jgi:6,7-dimethyl-8-ribityllumazine synthase
MATALKNFPDYDSDKLPPADKMKIGIVVSEWNGEITEALRKGAFETLIKFGVKAGNITVKTVPGSFELTLGAQFFAEYGDFDAIICIGCIIKGETPHFDYICQSVTTGITSLNIKYNIPFIFCVLTTGNINQARERAGGKYGNKGDEAAVAAIKMAALNDQMRSPKG